MSDAEKKAALTAMTGEANADVLSTYLSLAKSVILHYAYPVTDPPETFPSKYDELQVDIAAYKLNKRGAEGETSHSENGVSRGYEDADVPKSLLRQIVPLAGVVV